MHMESPGLARRFFERTTGAPDERNEKVRRRGGGDADGIPWNALESFFETLPSPFGHGVSLHGSPPTAGVLENHALAVGALLVPGPSRKLADLALPLLARDLRDGRCR